MQSANTEYFAMIVSLILVVIVFKVSGRNSRKKQYSSFLKSNAFEANYEIPETIAIEVSTKRLLLKSSMGYKTYGPSEIIRWSTGHDFIRVGNNSYTKYYIEFNVKDLDEPNPRAWFGNNNQERDKWFARVSTLYNN